nr:hypothetical protein FVER53263_13967 [Fusarium verticillioides]
MATQEKKQAELAKASKLANVPHCEQYERMISGMLYDSLIPKLTNARLAARKAMNEYNTWFPEGDDFNIENITKRRAEMLKSFLGHVEDDEVFIEPPFRVDYGPNMSVGKRFYANFNLTVLDSAIVTIGDRVMIGPNVMISTATHETEVSSRRACIELEENVFENGRKFLRDLLLYIDAKGFMRAIMRKEYPYVSFKIHSSHIAVEFNDDGFTKRDLEHICLPSTIEEKSTGEDGLSSVFKSTAKTYLQSEDMVLSSDYPQRVVEIFKEHGDTWLPLKTLTDIVESYMEQPGQFPFLRSIQGNTGDIDTKWNFLSEYLLVGKEDNLDFRLEILRSIRRSDPKKDPDRQLQKVLDLYASLYAQLTAPGEMTTDREKLRNFFGESGIAYFNGKELEWTSSSFCLWDAPPDMVTMRSLKSCYDIQGSNAEVGSALQNLFLKTLGIPNASLEQIVAELNELRLRNDEDPAKILRLYDFLNTNIPSSQDIRRLTIYVPMDPATQDVCFRSVLPRKLATWIMQDPESSDRPYVDIEMVNALTAILASETTSLDEILDELGIARISYDGLIDDGEEVTRQRVSFKNVVERPRKADSVLFGIPVSNTSKSMFVKTVDQTEANVGAE